MNEIIEANKGTSLQTTNQSKELQTLDQGGMSVFDGDLYLSPVDQYIMKLGSPASARTVKTRMTVCAQIWGCEHYDQIVWTKLTKMHILGIIKTLENQNKSISTIKNTLSCLKGVLSEAYDLELITTENYERMRNVKPPKGQQVSKGRSLEPEEIKRLFEHVANLDTVIGARDNAIVKLLIGTGLRRTEITNIKINDINLTSRLILIRGKGNKERRVAMNNDIYSAVQKWIDEFRGDYEGFLFSRIRKCGTIVYDKKISDQAIYDIVKKRCSECEITNIATHDLRRTFCTYMLSQGIDVMDVMKMMGHASPETTKRYDKSGDDRAMDIMKNMNF